MRFMLDTNTCVELIRRRNDRILRKIQRLRPDDLCVSSVTLSEMEYGAAKSAYPEKNRLALAEFMTALNVLAYDDAVAPVYGRVRAELERAGDSDRSVGHHDSRTRVVPWADCRDRRRGRISSCIWAEGSELGKVISFPGVEWRVRCSQRKQ